MMGRGSSRVIQELCEEVRELKKTVEEQSKQIKVGNGNACEGVGINRASSTVSSSEVDSFFNKQKTEKTDY